MGVGSGPAVWEPPPRDDDPELEDHEGVHIAQTWVPVRGAPVAVTTTRDRRHGRERIVTASSFVICIVVVGLIAVHNDNAAGKWRRLDAAQVQISKAAGQQVQTANANVTTLNSQVKSLQGQVSGMQSQLSSVANQKEKAIDQTSVYAQLLSAAGQVANDLQSCIADTNLLYRDLVAATASDLQSLESEAQTVASTCGQAETDNSILQSAIRSASPSPAP